MNRSPSPVLLAGARRATLRACIVAAGLLLATSDAFAQNARPPQNFTVVPITITGVTVQNGQLFANGLIGSNPFTAPLLVSSEPSDGPCPILNLQLGPIDLTLLGLRVETSQICLDVTAQPGGGLLGDLLCGVANLLQGGLSLTDILGQLQALGTLDRFLNGLTALLNQTFDNITANTNLVGATCEVLSLALGPIDLNLLGLVVELDDCAGGPVTVDITAIPGGGLLGDLLCGLAGGPLNNPLTPAVQRLLFQVALLLGGLLA